MPGTYDRAPLFNLSITNKNGKNRVAHALAACILCPGRISIYELTAQPTTTVHLE